jgi:hypothetical protein
MPTWLGMLAATTTMVAVAGPVAAQAVAVEEADPSPARSLTIVGVSPPPPGADGRLRYELSTTGEALTIDGQLDEPGWAEAVVIPLPWEVGPADNGRNAA